MSRWAWVLLTVAFVLLATSVSARDDSRPRPERCDPHIVLLGTRTDGAAMLEHTSEDCAAWVETAPRLGR
jgi:hypothetical protein